MATLYTVLSAIQSAVSSATTGLVSSSPDTSGTTLTVEVGIGWPSERTLMDNVRGGANPTALVSVYDRTLSTNSTRWLNHEVGRSITAATLTAIASSTVIPPGQFITVTLGGTITPGDAIAALFTQVIGQTTAEVAIGGSTDTTITMATQLAGLINADPVLSLIVSASSETGGRSPAPSNVVTLTSIASTPIRVAFNVGNGATRTLEIGRRNRQVQVTLWTRTEDDRITVGDPIESAVALMERDFGPTFPDGTRGRVLFVGDRQIEDATLADTYRRDFFLSVDYPVTTTDALYAILAPIARNTTF